MKNNVDIHTLLISNGYTKDLSGIYKSDDNKGYWSNLDKDENKLFVKLLKEKSPLEAVKEFIPDKEDHIFSIKREAALELLEICEGDICIDYGCMWGVLSIGLAKRGAKVISIDQTEDSLAFLDSRIKYEGFNNIVCVQDDIRKTVLKNSSNIAVVNGVLEWVPETGDIEIKNYYGKKNKKSYSKISPHHIQIKFLENVYNNLVKDGKLLLAIENRYDYKQFIGGKDPHVNLYFTSFLPRWMSNIISNVKLHRPYVNYLYSFFELKRILKSVGFSHVDLYIAFPHYHAPLFILPYDTGIRQRFRLLKYRKSSWKLKLFIIFKFFAPSIIAIAKK